MLRRALLRDLFSCIILFAASDARVFGSDPTIEQLKTNIAAAYENFRQVGDRYQDDYREQVYRMIGDKEVLEGTKRSKRRSRPDGYRLIETISVESPTGSSPAASAGDRVSALTPQYDFYLRANRPGQWMIDRCVIAGTPESEADRKSREPVLSAAPHDPHYRNGINTLLTTFLANDKVKIQSLTKSPANTACYRISYEGAGDTLTSGPKNQMNVAGWIDLSPDLNWSVVESNQVTKLSVGEANTNHRFTVRRVEGVVLVTHHEQLTVSKFEGKNLKTRLVYEFEPRLSGDADPREFTLSHYGLPEPVGIAPPPKPWPRYVWFLIAAGGLAAIALLSRWVLALRRRSRPSPTHA
jgi:hypothetical protein